MAGITGATATLAFGGFPQLSWSSSLLPTKVHCDSPASVEHLAKKALVHELSEDNNLSDPRYFTLEPGTGLYLPNSLFVGGDEHVLVGSGARQVTFIRINVYAAGIYVKKAHLESAEFRSFIEKYKDPSSESSLSAFLNLPIDLVLRVCPSRSTSGPHMRNGFSKFMLQKLIDNKHAIDENTHKASCPCLLSSYAH